MTDEEKVEYVKSIHARVTRAEQDRNRHQSRIDDCYRLCLPWRHLTNQHESKPSTNLDDIFDETGMTVIEDFAADMLSIFTPTKSRWLEIAPTQRLDQGDTRILAEALEKYQEVLFAEMRRSNLYQALQESYLDLGPGTMALLIDDLDISQPIHCQAIPLTDLLLDRGPYGEVDGKFRKWKVRATDAKVIWPDAKYPPQEPPIKPEDTREWDIIDGVYRDRSDKGTERHSYVVLRGRDLLIRREYTGEGSCPFIVARWSRDSTTAWGIGPTYRSLPALKTLNHIKYLGLKNLDKVVDPVTSYEDDGTINIDQGIDPGDWIPRGQGSKAPEIIESKTGFDVEWMHIDEQKSSIRRAHYQDRPEQTGKTPPTATQWMDEAAERARRMGSPATNLVIELQYPIAKRFAYLLNKRGVLPKVQLQGRDIALQPVSPLLRAQEQEEVVRVDRFLEILATRFGPQVANVYAKHEEIIPFLAEKMGIKVSFVRNQQEVQQAIQQAAQIAMQQQAP